MALDCTSLTKLTLVLCVAAARGFPPVSGCSDAYGRAIPPLSSCSDAYGRAISDFCVTKFTLDMEDLDQSLWCSWSDTFQPYEELTNCTYSVAHKMHCFWPNQQIDELFIRLHRDYFHDCALTGRLLRDPPIRILGPFIGLPVLVTLLMTALVVWSGKCCQGIV
ncbi:receptor activity-modifying protein 1 isoform X2 [Oncorhynchus kisutch]|uniref:receptor activity-modifying protein 1 isoform X2 n=1 Tax=Oncorhynchus kisutch TaxID=8019 RepID=UPI0012DE09EB|nr:receptor activity-modifying protein 1 isoform X2 [Oncorhynchus kisutch]